MTKDLEKLAKNLYKEMFGEVLEIPVIFNKAFITTLGRAFYKPVGNRYKPTRLEIAYNLTNNLEHLLFTLKHELIHIYLYDKFVDNTHGKRFQNYAIKYGAYTINPHTGRKSFTVLYASTLPKGGAFHVCEA
jgi:Zn-dependent peptidase ImmA (M78 family)